MHYLRILLFTLVSIALGSCSGPVENKNLTAVMPVYKDSLYLQDYSIKYELGSPAVTMAFTDRNGVVQVLSKDGILRPNGGYFLHHGQLIPDRSYRPLGDKNIAAMTLYREQFIYLDDLAVLSNAWAGSLYLGHDLPHADLIQAGTDFDFLISDGKTLQFLSRDKAPWKAELETDSVVQIRYQKETNKFWILGQNSISTFDATTNTFRTAKKKERMTAFDLQGDRLVIGTPKGYFMMDADIDAQPGAIQDKLPVTEITWVETIGDNVWFGSPLGAFKKRDDGKFDYYYGKRWLPGNYVTHISKGKDNSILISTDGGLAQIVFRPMTLYQKAQYYEEQVRKRHIRLGFNASLDDMENGNVDTGRLSDSDNDGLWTSMYLAAEVFRYATTRSDEALQNCIESMDAMERLFNINDVPGFPSRSFERSGYIEQLHDPDRWQHTQDPEWDWKSTTSSDEAIGHIFAYGVMAELMENDLKQRAITLIDTLMGHIVDNDLYLVDFDGKPTTWGKWNPEYVNARPVMVGDRKINSSNIIAMLQTAYHFTGKEKYKEKAFDLMENHGYLENLMRPMKEIGRAPEDADEWSKMLSESWNHSDDEMYFLGYWGLYRYAFNDTLKTKYKEAILDHWEAERPERDGAWNIITALTGTPEFDLDHAAWYLREHPMDLITWNIKNSHRKDIEFIEPNFRKQTIKEVLPPDERPVQRHNANMFRLDKLGPEGTAEYSAGDIWLLPYWMGRYLGVISEPMAE
ncbi:ligand-binding sensor domain-containing protein [Pseudozobellia thermophila]|uniref:Uncharacterized protein n=1 Tax=Pseudozobellia thermophila TaxID=192903 RepID=A0A1M6I4D5_9FLAO|nr:hypothetical protein [Pseudozobellia thermophila]SHJ29282.1 hypothetical protein SAMN04488513_103322 [Pseudozobellia thermophila]